jgi:membrane fusion protein, multidrug efflux system
MDLPRKARRPALLLPAFALAALGLMTGATGCSSGKAEAKKDDAPPAVPVEVAKPKRGDMLAVYSGTAPIEAEQEAVVVAKVGGEVRQLLVEEGARVRAGQVLARLDGDRLRLEAAQARANLAKLERDYKRNVELQQRGLVAASAFENLRYELDGARASYELAALQLSYTEIRAPIDGVVAERFLKVGNTVSPNEKAFRVADLTPLVTYVHVPEREMHKLKVRQVASAQVDAAGGAFDSVIARISPVVDSATGTFKVTLELQDAKAQLKPGMFARVNIVYDRRKDVLQVPRSALIEDDGRTRLFIVEQGKAVARDVTLGLTNGGIVEVIAGLKDGDQVVVVGQGGLKSGNPVRVVGNTPAASAKPAAAR